MALKPDKNVYLIGPRACGKTTLGRMLAKRLDRPFVDLDEAFVSRTNRTVAQVVEAEGWEGFRALESEVLASEAETGGKVVATGGGVVLKEPNRRVLAKGVVIYLQADPDRVVATLVAELNPDQRPALTDLPLEEEVRRTLAEREPFYLACAQFVAPERPLDEQLERLVGELERWPG